MDDMTEQQDIVRYLRDMDFDKAAALIETQAATITALRAELAGRDAEIVAWLRSISQGAKMPSAIATAIETGAYRKGQGDEQHG